MSWIIDLLKGVRGKSTDKVDELIRQKRLNNCNDCTQLMRTGQCSLCGCFVLDKTRYKDEKCPDNKW